MIKMLIAIAWNYQISLDDLIGSSRKGFLPEARKMACYLLIKKHRAKDIASCLGIDRSYVHKAIEDMSFYINTYPILKQRLMSINEITQLHTEAAEIEQWLRKNYNLEKTIVHQKQRELESINQKLKEKCQ